MNQPEYLIANPIHNGFYKVPYQYETQLHIDIFNEIQHTRVRVPLKLYVKCKISDPESYIAPIIIER
jgi:hypothetical protein